MSGLGGLGNMIGGAVGSIFGGPLGAKIGSMIGSTIGQLLQKMIGQFGMNNVAGGLANCLNHSFANTALQHIANSGAPTQVQDRMSAYVRQHVSDNMQNVPSDCQNQCNHVFVQINNTYNGDSSTGNINDAIDRGAEGVSNLDKKKYESKSGGPQNWLVALARALADIQTKFLDAAMKNLDKMQSNASAMDEKEGAKANSSSSASEAPKTGKDTGATGSSKGEFLKAQAEFQANFQMFNMTANMTATSLKSLGEGLTAIARKQ